MSEAPDPAGDGPQDGAQALRTLCSTLPEGPLRRWLERWAEEGGSQEALRTIGHPPNPELRRLLDEANARRSELELERATDPGSRKRSAAQHRAAARSEARAILDPALRRALAERDRLRQQLSQLLKGRVLRAPLPEAPPSQDPPPEEAPAAEHPAQRHPQSRTPGE